ncbi:MAG: protein-glutamate O-methyltransferase CheR [Candidatus Cohnella colombiensis]|uniref:protein-glutamate O-methyltransferase n=1 Tax=Candidatus Cohnella colombiensis TaxID=3121368 RepID=A0AA95JHB1_9BACL|nr:MAG: protein-glutamate O-methyltransferase CheR [Cohnella sp.]
MMSSANTKMFNISNREFAQLASFIQENYGIYLKEEKKTLVTSRLHNVLQKLGIDNFTDYYQHLISDKSGAAVEQFIEKITTNHTFFMRESDHFQYFKEKVLPYFSYSVKSKDLRVWCAGCSTGEEAYTLAMLMDEFFSYDKSKWDKKLLATDISDKVLNIATNGEYESENIATLPKRWRNTYFTKSGEDKVRVNDWIKNEVIFRRFNLVTPIFPFRRKFHIIFCRNVMIYFENHTKNQLVQRFSEWLEPGGYLFIGHSESIDRNQSGFSYVMPAVYRKN